MFVLLSVWPVHVHVGFCLCHRTEAAWPLRHLYQPATHVAAGHAGALGNPGFSGGLATSVSMAVDGTDGTPLVAFVDYSTEQRASVMRYSKSGSGWKPVGR
jgi:hypothetical protein